jgi:hypothetical protein
VTARGDVASSQAPPWPKNRLRIRPTDISLVEGAYPRGTRQRVESCEQVSSGVEPITGGGASVMRYWALRLGREAPPCMLSRERKGARGEPAGESNESSRYIAYKAHGSVPVNRVGGQSWPLADRPPVRQ